MPTYLLTTTNQPAGNRILHSAAVDCSLLVETETCVNLGEHPDCESAMKMAKSEFQNVDGCPECSPECNDRVSSDALAAAIAAAVTVGNM